MIAVKRLQSLFWVLLVALGALGAYLVSLKVATERNELMRVRAQIARAQSDVRYLETEFSARGNMRQLERWNAEDFFYAAPTAVQYLGGERALAHLDGIQPNGPDYVAPPVMVAMADMNAGEPMAVAMPAPVAAPVPTITAAATPIVEELSVIRSARAADNVDRIAPVRAKAGTNNASAVTVRDSAKPDAVARQAERMAMLDASLLDSRTLGDLTARAARESKGAKR
ncbi:MAG: colicin transporter [Sphingobium sp.]